MKRLMSVLAIAGMFSSTAALGDTCELVFENGAHFTLPTATTLEQQAKGLSGKADPAPGMVFIWDEPAMPGFWMKDTPAPLSAAFIEPSGRVSSVQQMAPLSMEHHYPPRPVIAVIELPQGGFKKAGIAEGDLLETAPCIALAGDD